MDLITLAHLHQGRVLPNTKTNVIEAGPNQKFREEKDWYYNIEKENEKSERCGPVTFTEVGHFQIRISSKHELRNRKDFQTNCSADYDISVEGTMGSEEDFTKNPMLGNWNGWLACSAAVTSAEMVSNGQRDTIVQ